MLAHIEDVDKDGDLYLLLQFNTQGTNLTESSTEATLTGNIYDGTPFKGLDTVNIVPSLLIVPSMGTCGCTQFRRFATWLV